MGSSGRGPRGTNQDPEDFPALVLPAGSSTDLPDYEDAVVDQKMDAEQGRETPVDNFWSNYTGIWGGICGCLSTDNTGTSLLLYFT